MDNSDYKFILSIAVVCLKMIALGVVCTYHKNQLIANAADPIEMKCALSGRSDDPACIITALSRK
jgi:hypothetical protein